MLYSLLVFLHFSQEYTIYRYGTIQDDKITQKQKIALGASIGRAFASNAKGSGFAAGSYKILFKMTMGLSDEALNWGYKKLGMQWVLTVLRCSRTCG